MGWFSNAKKDYVYEADIPEDKDKPSKLRGRHPVIIDSVDGDKAKVIGCSSNAKTERYGAVKVETENNKFSKDTYAQCHQGLTEISEKDVIRNRNDKVTNGDQIRSKLK